MTNEEYLAELAAKQKESAKSQLENTLNTTVSDLNKQAETTKKTYATSKNTANVNSQINAKNFAEYLANRGLSSSGIASQYESSRQNTLSQNLNKLTAEEQSTLNDLETAKTEAQTTYNNDLASQYADIEANYIQNLLDNKQQEFENQLSLKSLNSGSSRSSGSSISLSDDNYEVNTAYYQGNLNSDAQYGTFSNGYQPNNVGGKKLSKTGNTVTFNTQTLSGQNQTVTQNIWQTSDGTKYYWDGRYNKYIKIS